MNIKTNKICKTGGEDRKISALHWNIPFHSSLKIKQWPGMEPHNKTTKNYKLNKALYLPFHCSSTFCLQAVENISGVRKTAFYFRFLCSQIHQFCTAFSKIPKISSHLYSLLPMQLQMSSGSGKRPSRLYPWMQAVHSGFPYGKSAVMLDPATSWMIFLTVVLLPFKQNIGN